MPKTHIKGWRLIYRINKIRKKNKTKTDKLKKDKILNKKTTVNRAYRFVKENEDRNISVRKESN